MKEREKVVIDSLIDMGPQKAGDLDRECVHSLYKYVAYTLQYNAIWHGLTSYSYPADLVKLLYSIG